jgi:hypothetical protein
LKEWRNKNATVESSAIGDEYEPIQKGRKVKAVVSDTGTVKQNREGLNPSSFTNSQMA